MNLVTVVPAVSTWQKICIGYDYTVFLTPHVTISYRKCLEWNKCVVSESLEWNKCVVSECLGWNKCVVSECLGWSKCVVSDCLRLNKYGL